jgi:hypothetical protein
MILREKPLFVIWKSHEEIMEEDVWTAFQQLVLLKFRLQQRAGSHQFIKECSKGDTDLLVIL